MSCFAERQQKVFLYRLVQRHNSRLQDVICIKLFYSCNNFYLSLSHLLADNCDTNQTEMGGTVQINQDRKCFKEGGQVAGKGKRPKKKVVVEWPRATHRDRVMAEVTMCGGT